MAPIVFTKDVYIGTVPVNRALMESCSRGMYTRPGISASSGSNGIGGGAPSNHEGLSLADVVTNMSSHQQPVVFPSAPSDDSDQHYTQPPSVPDWHGGGWTLDLCQKIFIFFLIHLRSTVQLLLLIYCGSKICLSELLTTCVCVCAQMCHITTQCHSSTPGTRRFLLLNTPCSMLSRRDASLVSCVCVSLRKRLCN